MSVPRGDIKYACPDLTDAPAALLCVPIPLIPYVRRFVADMQQQHIWQSREDWFNAYQAFAQLEEELMAGCMQQLITEQQRLYRLWDTALNGTQYELIGDIISPELPTVPPASASAPNALRAHVGRIWQLGENAVAGRTAGAGEGVDGAPALTDDQTARDLLRRLTEGVDGNGNPAPGDNLLVALRGLVEADGDRNVIDASGGNLFELLDQVEQLLTDIKAALQ
jgi:hypothetical protein